MPKLLGMGYNGGDRYTYICTDEVEWSSEFPIKYRVYVDVICEIAFSLLKY